MKVALSDIVPVGSTAGPSAICCHLKFSRYDEVAPLPKLEANENDAIAELKSRNIEPEEAGTELDGRLSGLQL